MNVSIFESLKHVDQPYHKSLSFVLKQFQEKDKYNISEIRELYGDEMKTRKQSLPVVSFNGTFERRQNSGLIKSSGLMVLDFDNTKEDFNKKLHSDPFIYAYFKSTSGNGYKALVKIPEVKSDEEYKEYYYSMQERYEELDTSGKDISRCCFWTYDPELVIKKDAKTWTKKGIDKKRFDRRKNLWNDYERFNRVLNIIRYAQPGERNIKIYNASMLAGGYVEAGIMDYHEAIRLLEQEANMTAPDERSQNEKTIINGLKNGLQKPLKEIEELEKKETVEAKYGKVFYTARELKEDIDELYEKGLSRGYDFDFKLLSQKYTLKMGCTTYLYAAPYQGKTYFWFELLIQLSERHDLRHIIFSPETGSAPEVYAELIAMAAQRDFYKDYNNQMTKEEKESAFNFVDKYFLVVDTPDTMMELTEFYDLVDYAERFFGVKIHTTTIDPFNDFRHDFSKHNNRQDLYLEAMLQYIRENARHSQRHNCVITHVQDQKIIQDGEHRYYPLASYREISGGQAWSRKGQAMISIWRPPSGLQDEHGRTFLGNETIVAIQKAKPKGIGETGRLSLFYDYKRHRFYPDLEVDKLYGLELNYNEKFAQVKNNVEIAEDNEPF